jgi:hypothetical protein
MKLTGLENTWAEAALGTIFPGSIAEGLADIGGMDVRGHMSEVMARAPFNVAFGLRVAIWLVALAPLFVIGRAATITRIGAVDRERVIASLIASKYYLLRSLLMVLKTIGALLYAGDDGVRARLRLPPKPRTTVALRLKGARAV